MKNGLMLSYLIDLTKLIQYQHKMRSSKSSDSEPASMSEEQLSKCMQRLNEMKVIIEKIKPLEKKMRYQLDKLLTISSSSSSFALGGENKDDNHNNEDTNEGGDEIVQMEESDPLAFRPNLDSMLGNDDDSDDNEHPHDSSEESDEGKDDGDDRDEDESEDEDDEEILAARAALKAGRALSSKKKKQSADYGDGGSGSDMDANNGVYKAPRMTAVLFEEKERQKVREERLLKKQRDRMKKSELLSTLRATYGDMPEEDDFGGGANLGKQRESARRLAEREAEKTKFEEEAFVRLTTSRKDKKMKNRIMREEISNLHSIADIGNLTAGVSLAFGKEGMDRDDEVIRVTGSSRQSSRHANGKRRRNNEYEDGSSSSRKGKRRNDPKNSYQRALFGIDGSSGQKKKSKK